MSFHDLPSDWATRPVTDPHITADLLDLVVRHDDRMTGAIAILMCGPDHRLFQPAVVALPPTGVEPGEHRRIFDVMCQGMVSATGSDVPAGERGGILVAVARARQVFVTGDDRQWRDAAVRSCADHGVEHLGTWLVTPSVIREVEPPAADVGLVSQPA